MKNIFLVGMPSSGKSTLGRRLARALGLVFVDLDKAIVRDQRMKIPEIFREKGQDFFRELEARMLREALYFAEGPLLVATGGGTPCYYQNIEYMKSNGLSIFLNVAPSELAARILNHNKDDRPLLSQIKAEDLEARLSEGLADRLPFYAQADLTISDKTSVPQIVALVRPLL